ncbi:MAG: hypothetical protein NO516_00870 [Candidatus Methanomethylicia archaeon]|nr:hypothetical protein [Candidatus Methanomethylicia archaeon]
MASDLEEKILLLLQNSPEGVILQSELWKILDSGSREVSRSLAKMAKRNLILREPYSDGGRKTFKVILLKKKPKIELDDILWCCCFTCHDLSKCGMGLPISPEMCPKLTISLRNEMIKMKKQEELKKISSQSGDGDAKEG